MRATIDTIGALLAKRAHDVTGRVSLSGPEIVTICERDVGVDVQRVNPWFDWLNGG